MEMITIFYILNSSLLLLHEIESAFEKEWEILKLPIKITGFLILHVPIVLILFYGALEIEKQTQVGLILGILLGISGSIPLIVHKIVLRRKDHFDLPISNIILYSNTVIGTGTAVLSAHLLT